MLYYRGSKIEDAFKYQFLYTKIRAQSSTYSHIHEYRSAGILLPVGKNVYKLISF
jgi:hypothetical protein